MTTKKQEKIYETPYELSDGTILVLRTNYAPALVSLQFLSAKIYSKKEYAKYVKEIVKASTKMLESSEQWCWSEEALDSPKIKFELKKKINRRKINKGGENEFRVDRDVFRIEI